MTEAEWRECGDPGRMLTFLGDRLSDRKLRLFGCACCRTVWRSMTDTRSRHAVEVAECYADELANREEVDRAAVQAFEASGDATTPAFMAADAALHVSGVARQDVLSVWRFAATATEGSWLIESGASSTTVDQWADRVVRTNRPTGYCGADPSAPLVALLRDVAGDPFRPVTADPAWLTPTAVGVAAAIYDRRTFHDLPVLADALQDAGCDDAAVLGHCRGDGPHVRGCWVVDMVLGKG